MQFSVAQLAGYFRYARRIRDTFPVSKNPSKTKKSLEWFDSLPEQQRREFLIAAMSLGLFVEILIDNCGPVDVDMDAAR